MNIYILFLVLSSWTVNCSDTNQSDTVSATGTGSTMPMPSKMDDFRKRLLIFIIGIMIIAFVFTCFCFLHYNCMGDDALTSDMEKRQGISAMSSYQSKILTDDFKITNSYSLERYLMMSAGEMLAPLPGEEMLSPPYSTEKLIGSPCAQNISMASDHQVTKSDKSDKKSSKSSRKSTKSHHSEKSNRTQSLENTASIQKVDNPVCPHKPIEQPPVVKTHSPPRSVKSPCLPQSRNQILSCKPSRPKKSAKLHKRFHLKKSCIRNEAMLSRPLLAKRCHCFKERCLVCNPSSELLLTNISDAMKSSLNFYVSSKRQYYSVYYPEVDSNNESYQDSMSNDDSMTYDSDDSNEEIIILCNTRYDDDVPKHKRNTWTQ
ncbi:uncharacterized protein CXorf66 homolog [Perognathus longimembris pacificus]|uniref:uncharacterized protein CXorf66 homolog n=1 Tax=Perognathus longimembris pacificus TaxID=214514 RepID=UPI002019C9DE|nr:uncharacterized protein CXorf66 homolog [Perognathus longimembris pacificus]